MWRYVFVDLFLLFFFSCSVVCWSNTVIVFVDVYFGDVRFGHVDLSLARILFLFLFTWRCVYLELCFKFCSRGFVSSSKTVLISVQLRCVYLE